LPLGPCLALRRLFVSCSTCTSRVSLFLSPHLVAPAPIRFLVTSPSCCLESWNVDLTADVIYIGTGPPIMFRFTKRVSSLLLPNFEVAGGGT
jgi:hypothetical protein